MSCNNKLTEGKIINKYYEPEYKYSTTVIIRNVPSVRWHTSKEKFIFIMEGFNGEDTVIQKVEVDAVVYNNFKIGDYIKLD